VEEKMTIKLSAEAVFTFFFLLLFAFAIFTGWDWPMIAKLLPVYVVAIPGLILAGVQLYRDLTATEENQAEVAGGVDMDETFVEGLDKRTEIVRTLVFFGWFVAGALAIWLLGIVIALPLLVFFYSRIEGREKWYICIVLAVTVFLIIWGLFEYLLESRWPPGALFS
jgi:putative tricarboxylic transport membrane protein